MVKNFKPKVSIVIPVYNGSNYLKEAIDSALAQTYKNIEVIVINDGSNDNGATEKIAKSYGDKIQYFKKENGGVATALNLGLEKMTGEYFSWLSHDDMCYPDKIRKQVSESINWQDGRVIVSDWTIIDSNKKTIKNIIIDDRLEISPMCFLAFDRSTWLNACAVLFPVELFQKYGHFDEKLKTTQDYDLLFRFMRHNLKFKILHEPLLYSRQHLEQGSIIDPSALMGSDIIHEKIIKTLSDHDMSDYFNNNREVMSVYEAFLSNHYKRAPHIIENRILSKNHLWTLHKYFIYVKIIIKKIHNRVLKII